MWWMMNGGFSWWWMLLGWVWMVIFWGGIIALIVWVISRLSGQRSLERATPLDVAKERYARGDITREQFEQIKKDLG